MSQRPTVCLAYLWHPADEWFLEMSREVMSGYDWITKIVCLGTCIEKAEFHTEPNTRWVSHDYGRGFDKQPENGGFHELAARNKLYKLAQESDCDWVLICDADEFYTENTIDVVQAAAQEKKDVIWFPCYHFCAPETYVWWPNTVSKRHGQLMHDPHPRAFRLGRNWPWTMNYNNKFRDGLKNRTMHCHVKPHPTQVVHFAPGLTHVHVRHMFDPKRPDKEKLARMEQRAAGVEIIPEIYRRAWEQQEAES